MPILSVSAVVWCPLSEFPLQLREQPLFMIVIGTSVVLVTGFLFY